MNNPQYGAGSVIDLGPALESVQRGKEAICQEVNVQPKQRTIGDFLNWENFQKINGVWGAIGDGQNALTLWNRLKKIKYVSRGTTGGFWAFGKNTYGEMMKSNGPMALASVVMSALDTDLGKYVIETTPEAMEAMKRIAGSTSEDWNELSSAFTKAMEKILNDPEFRDMLWDEYQNGGKEEILEPFRLITVSVFQGFNNLFNPFS